MLAPSYELSAAFAYARKYSLERTLYYIDSQLLLLGILETGSSDIAIDAPDREKMIFWLNTLNWEKGQRQPKKDTLPLTAEAERMLENAVYYQKKLGDKHLSAQHIILSILTIENRCQYKFQSLGIVYETYLEILKNDRGIQDDIPLHAPGIKVPFSARYYPFLRWLYSAKKKQQIVERYFREAQSGLQYNEWVKCRTLCQHILYLDPTHINTLWLMGVSFRAERKFADALPYYEKVLEKHSAHTGVIAEVAHCYSEMGNHHRAMQLYSYALSLNPGSSELLNSLGFTCIHMQLFIEAISYFDQAIAYDEACAFAYNNKGYVLMRLGHSEPAEELMYRSLQFNKGNSYAYRNLGILYMKQNNISAARDMLLTAKRYHFNRKYGNEVDELLRKLPAYETV
jgi:tetratricopeptide (TPR) repeat protein